MKKNSILGIKMRAVMIAAVAAAAFSMQISARDAQDVESDVLAWMDQAIANAGSNYDAFRALYTSNSPEDTVQSDFSTDWSRYTGKDQHFATVVIDADPYYYVDITSAICAGSYPDTHSEYSDWGVAFRYEDENTLKADFSEEALAVLNEHFFDILPDGMADAHNNGRNATEFNASRYWYMNSNHVVHGSLDTLLKYAWQDEEGNLWVALLASNGTDANRAFNSITLTLADDALGTVYEGSLDGFTLMNVQNTLKVYQIPYSEVRTGTETWGSMNYSIDTTNM